MSIHEFDHVLREFQSIVRLISALPIDEQKPLLDQLERAMNANDQLTALAALLVGIVVPQAAQS